MKTYIRYGCHEREVTCKTNALTKKSKHSKCVKSINTHT